MQKYLKIILPIIYTILLFPKINYGFDLQSILMYMVLGFWGCYILRVLFTSNNFQCSYKELFLITFVLILKVLNCLFLHSNIISLVLFIIGISVITSFYTTSRLRLFWLSIVVILFLPIKEYTQIFIGTPLRFLGVYVISGMFNLLGFFGVTQSSVIMLENKCTNIDYICSGNSTILILFLFIAICGFIFRVPICRKSFFVVCGGFFAFVVLNIFRIFLLILFDMLNFNTTFLNLFHQMLGLFNFGILFCLLYYFLSQIRENRIIKVNVSKNLGIFVLFLGLICLPLKLIKLPQTCFGDMSIFHIADGLSLTSQEYEFYSKHRSIVTKSFVDDGVVKLTIESNSWLSHHNPENCIRGAGNNIISSKIITVDDYFIRLVKTNNGYVYYFFTDGEVVVDDYYKRVYLSISTKSKNWTLVEYSTKNLLDDEFLRKEIMSYSFSKSAAPCLQIGQM